ncbi:MAG TPA: hypothetical protein VN540_10340, partial [Clostridia bacterium]|nr:hypothetical protein [Clostridia bacterium]
MAEHPLLGILKRHPEYERLASNLASAEGCAAVFGLGEAHRTHVAAGLFADCEKTLLLVTANETSAARIAEDAAYYIKNVCHLPARETPLGGKAVAISAGLAARRVEALTRLASGERLFLIVSAEALLQRLVPPEALMSSAQSLKLGQRVNLRALTASLVDAGYERVDLCEGKGQFCLRGGYLDLFPITADLPVRVEFFDDEIDTMRTYDPASQRSVENISSCAVPPATEVPLTARARETGMRVLRKKPRLEAEYQSLKQGVAPPGADRLLPLFYPEAYITDYLPKDAVVLIDEPQRVEESAKLAHNNHLELVSAFLSTGDAEPEEAELLGSPLKLISLLDTPRTAMLFALTRTYGLI